MELKKLIRLLILNKKNLVIYGLVGGTLGLTLFLWPAKYITTGSFYVKRNVDASIDFFTYEGYYGQQNAVGFTNTVVALFESVDVQSKALAKAGFAVNENTLQKLAKNIKVTKYGPQLITLTVKGNTATETNRLWRYLADETQRTIVSINEQGDPKLGLSTIAEQPVSRKIFKSPFIYIPAGMLLGLVMGVFIISYKEYDS
jgi:capsular polysaccharide biosynthesis protein